MSTLLGGNFHTDSPDFQWVPIGGEIFGQGWARNKRIHWPMCYPGKIGRISGILLVEDPRRPVFRKVLKNKPVWGTFEMIGAEE